MQLVLAAEWQRVESVTFLISIGCTGAAWLSSARVVRCLVKSLNERNPRCCLLSTGRPTNSRRKWGGCQVSMALKGWATHVLQG